MACNDCSLCECGNKESLTGGFGAGVQAFLSENPVSLGDPDDLLWELAAGQVAMDPTEPLEIWEDQVRQRFAVLKDGVSRGG
jgi:hypothetical protein